MFSIPSERRAAVADVFSFLRVDLFTLEVFYEAPNSAGG